VKRRIDLGYRSLGSLPAPYDAIAPLYDSHWGNAFASHAKPVLREHLLGNLPPGATVLELCCGTGLLLQEMSASGCECFGVDESAGMLQIAAGNAPHSRLQQADMARFRWNRRFDAALCLYNGVNHARSARHFAATLHRVRSHLKQGGLFLFDYVLPAAFASDWDYSEVLHEGARKHAIRYEFDARKGVATCMIGRDVRIRQLPFETSTVREALRDAGFALIREMPMPAAPPLGGRRLVLATTAPGENYAPAP
jgi:SAM-dependent methyltransferase